MNSQSEDIGFKSSKPFEITFEIFHKHCGEVKPVKFLICTEPAWEGRYPSFLTLRDGVWQWDVISCENGDDEYTSRHIIESEHSSL